MRIIGKFLSIAFFSIASSIDISVSTLDGVVVNEVSINSPFLLKVAFKDLDCSSKFDVVGLDAKGIVSRFRGVSNLISNVNGSVTKTKVYSYIVEINKEGVYELGPVAFGSYKSNILKLKALESPKNLKENSFDYKIDVKVSKTKVFLGQEIDLEVLVTARSDIKLESVSPLDFNLFFILNSKNNQNKNDIDPLFDLYLAQDFETSSDFLNGVKVTTFKWVHKLYPNKMGRLKIPKFEAVLAVSSNNHYFFPTYSYKKTYSNEIEIEVDELPIKEKNIPVGTFDLFEIRLDNSKFTTNDAANLTLILRGSSKFQDIEIKELFNVPEGVTVYKSKSNILNDYSGKTFEFVLQFNKGGLFEIPSQQFKFFDPIQKRVKTLKSKPLKIDVLQEESKDIKDSSVKDIVDAQNNSVEKKHSVDDYFPDKLFYFLIVLPFLLILAFYFLIFLRSSVTIQYLIIRFKFIYNKNLKFIFWAIRFIVALKYRQNIQDIDYNYLKNISFGTNYNELWIRYLDLLYSNIFAKEESEDKLYLIKNFVPFLKLIKKAKDK